MTKTSFCKDGELQQNANSGLQKVISAKEKHVDGNDDDYDASDDNTCPGTENTGNVFCLYRILFHCSFVVFKMLDCALGESITLA